MANISGYGAIASGTASSNLCLASVMSNNFAQIETAINSNKLNSDNYGASALLGSHINTSQIQSYHISAGQIRGTNIVSGILVESHMNYASSADGVRVLRVGGVSSDMPANGVAFVRHSYTFPINAGESSTNVTFSCGKALTTFTDTPMLLAMPIAKFPTAQVADTRLFGGNLCGIHRAMIKDMDSATGNLELYLLSSMTSNHSGTVYFVLAGALSG